jgi:DNA-directed RNA polymerase specialized sigma24 family protein
MNLVRRQQARLHLIEQYRNLARKLAWQYWKSLPVSTKVWVDVEDLIEDAYLYILSRATDTYDGGRGKWTTFLTTGISNLFLNFAQSQQTKKRFGWMHPLETLDKLGIGKRDEGVSRAEAIDALLSTYGQASDPCRGAMRQWFGVERRKVKRSAAAKQIYKEFQVLAERNRLSPNDCRKLMRGGLCLD